MEKVKFLLIGAGPTALGAAYRLKDLGEQDYLLVERNSWVGGLAASFKDPAGFTWDIGGHVQFSHYGYFDEAMKVALPPSEWLHHQRESWVWMKERFVPYPFQNNIRYLPRDSMWSCLKGLVDITLDPPKGKPANFGEWIMASFGRGVAEEFMFPYNFKVWAYHPTQMSYQWIGERVATIDLCRILENVVYEKMDASWGPNNTFQFPRQGGTGAIWDSIARHVGMDRILLNCAVASIDPEAKQVMLGNGRTIRYDHLLSTIPVDVLTTLVKGTPESVRRRAAQLKHSSSNIVGIGVQGAPHELLKTKCWMYFPEDNCPFYRMTMFSNYSPNNVPDIDRHFSLMCEVSESPEKPVRRDQLIQETIRGLYNTGLLLPENEVVSKWTYTAEYGYPTPSLDRDEILSDVIPYLDGRGVYSRGRFGGWKYEVSNQDHTFMQGVEWINFVVNSEPEKTFRVDTTQDPNLTLLRR
jgi:protoporphyrinogen oxidase